MYKRSCSIYDDHRRYLNQASCQRNYFFVEFTEVEGDGDVITRFRQCQSDEIDQTYLSFMFLLISCTQNFFFISFVYLQMQMLQGFSSILPEPLS